MYTIYCDGKPLYSPNLATEGYGVIDPKLSLELNKAGSLEFTLPPDNVMYNQISKLKSIVTVYKENEIIFKGRVLHDTKDYYLKKQVYCEGELAYLNDTIQRPYAFKGTLTDYFKARILQHNAAVNADKQFTVGTVTVTDPDTSETHEEAQYTLLTEKPDDWSTNYKGYYRKNSKGSYIAVVGSKAPKFRQNRFYKKTTSQASYSTNTVKNNTEYTSTIDELNKQLIDDFGGYLRVRYANNVRYLDYVAVCGEVSDQSIIFGENLLDLEEHITAEKLITCLVPLGAEDKKGNKTTIKKARRSGGLDYIKNNSMAALYGEIWATYEWNDVDSPNKLYEKGLKYLNESIALAVSLELSAVDLNLIDVDTERFKLGDSIMVISLPHGLNNYFRCTKIELDLVNPQNSTYTMGDSLTAMTDQQVKTEKMLTKKIVITKELSYAAQGTANLAEDLANVAQSASGSSLDYVEENEVS